MHSRVCKWSMLSHVDLMRTYVAKAFVPMACASENETSYCSCVGSICRVRFED